MIHRSLAAALAMLVACVGSAGLAAAEPPPPRDWEVNFFTYVWAAGIESEVETRAGDIEVEQDFSDILKDLELGAMGILDARWRRFVLVFDGVYTKVGDESDVLGGFARADVDFTQIILDTKLGFRVLDRVAPWGDASVPDAPRLRFDLLAGARYWYNGADVALNVPGTGLGRHVDESRDWADAIVGARVGVGVTRTINVSVIGDVGGFDIANSSELTWMVMPSLNWRPWDLVSFHVGYKHLEAERERPSTNNEFSYTMSGPVVGVGFHF
jgi:hypothetical protein